AAHPLLPPGAAISAGRAEQQADMQKNAAEFARLVPSVRWLEPAEVLRRQPLLKPEAAAGGAIFAPEARDMEVAATPRGRPRGGAAPPSRKPATWVSGGSMAASSRARAPRARCCGSTQRLSISRP